MGILIMNNNTTINGIDFGGYNDFPPNWREISAEEFAVKMNHYNFSEAESRQMREKDDWYNLHVPAQLFFYWDGTGLAVSYTNTWNSEKFKYDYTAKFFAFGCDHEYQFSDWNSEKFGPQFRCNHALKCKKCGHEYAVDSSD